ncbi:MAG: hypothetical protein ACK4RK_00455 [Gemmataceae bacterium]
MQTVNFQCGHCQSLMAVGINLLGQQVRCPHCQQVVVAPAAAPQTVPPAPPAPAPFSDEPPPDLSFRRHHAEDEPESIFGEVVDDDLFGQAPRSQVEMPNEPLPANLQLEPTNFQIPGMSAPPVPLVSPPPPTPNNGGLNFTANPPSEGTVTANTHDWMGGGATAPAPEEDNPIATDQIAVGVVERARAGARGESLFMHMILVVLIPYSIVMTIIAALLYSQLRSDKRHIHPLEELPDAPRQLVPARKVGQTTPPVDASYSTVSWRWGPELELPEKLQVELGKSVIIGDLEVTPLKVEMRKIVYNYRSERYQPEESENPALVLHLKLKNISKDAIFHPTDPAYTKQWRAGAPQSTRPYTYLEFIDTKRRLYGGPIEWRGGEVPQGKALDEYIVGQENDDKPLHPGEEMQTIICTDPDSRKNNHDVARLLNGYDGPLMWRVRLRRGLVELRRGPVSASAVIGVKFHARDVQVSS